MHFCPALFISAPASGQGKTTVTAAIAAYHSSLGRRVRVFKTGPDFIDPTLLEKASGHPVYQLDLWMGGEADCRARLYEAAAESDLILIEGVMGLFDGNPSSADLAKRFGIPVLAVIDAGKMAQTFAALAHGLARLDPDLPFWGVMANRVAGERHAAMLLERMPAELRFCGALPNQVDIALPERHLGLLQADELPDILTRIDLIAKLWGEHAEMDLPASVAFDPEQLPQLSENLSSVTIAVAKDAAFSFIYRANLDLLVSMGAELKFFSPTEDDALPQADSLYLPGGYPELHLGKLSGNQRMLDAIRAHHSDQKPIVAECGGMLYTLKSLTDKDGRQENLLGLLDGSAKMRTRLTAIALQQVELPQGSLRGHTFHYSELDESLIPVATGVCPNGGRTNEGVYQVNRLTASYIHFYFPSNPEAAAQLFSP